MESRYDTISFISDFGLVDESVGIVKSVIRSIAPNVSVIDITHEVAPFDVRAGSLALVRSANYLCPGVVLALVDPAIGTLRRAIAVEVGDGESILIGPDNGLLAPAVALVGGASRVIELANTEDQIASTGSVSDWRDVFAPSAAHVCNGVDIGELGNEVDATTLVPGVVPFSAEKNGVLEADVLWVDRFGNVQTNVDPQQLSSYGQRLQVVVSNQTILAKQVDSFAALGPGEAGLIVDAHGLIALVLDQASAAENFGVDVGASLTFSPEK